MSFDDVCPNILSREQAGIRVMDVWAMDDKSRYRVESIKKLVIEANERFESTLAKETNAFWRGAAVKQHIRDLSLEPRDKGKAYFGGTLGAAEAIGEDSSKQEYERFSKAPGSTETNRGRRGRRGANNGGDLVPAVASAMKGSRGEHDQEEERKVRFNPRGVEYIQERRCVEHDNSDEEGGDEGGTSTVANDSNSPRSSLDSPSAEKDSRLSPRLQDFGESPASAGSMQDSPIANDPESMRRQTFREDMQRPKGKQGTTAMVFNAISALLDYDEGNERHVKAMIELTVRIQTARGGGQ